MRIRSDDLKLYLVTDPDLCRERGVENTVLEAVRHGVTMVQLRDKSGDEQLLSELARGLKEKMAPFRLKLIINDWLDVALSSQADGLHVGQKDIVKTGIQEIREALGDKAVLGLTIETREQMAQIDDQHIDYLGLSSVFATPTKTDYEQELGLGGVRKLASMSALPTVAIGGINCQNAWDVMATGVDGIAVVSAICGQEDIEGATRLLRQEIDKADMTRTAS